MIVSPSLLTCHDDVIGFLRIGSRAGCLRQREWDAQGEDQDQDARVAESASP